MTNIHDITEDVKILEESVNGKKTGNYFIEGIFLQADVKNRNGRYYPQSACDAAVARYNRDYIMTGRSLGELGHPPNAGINLHLASHKITELRREGKNYIGKAKILDTPMGNIAKELIKEGVKLGVSLRGGAKIESKNGMDVVGDNFMLTTVDIVADPSMPDAFVEGIMESAQKSIAGGTLSEHDFSYIQESVMNISPKLSEKDCLDILENITKKYK